MTLPHPILGAARRVKRNGQLSTAMLSPTFVRFRVRPHPTVIRAFCVPDDFWSLPLRRNDSRQTRRSRILHRDQRVEHLVEPDNIAERPSLFENADGRFRNFVVFHHVVLPATKMPDSAPLKTRLCRRRFPSPSIRTPSKTLFANVSFPVTSPWLP